MNVKELIKVLKTLPGEAIVKVPRRSSTGYNDNIDNISVETEVDIADLGEEFVPNIKVILQGW